MLPLQQRPMITEQSPANLQADDVRLMGESLAQQGLARARAPHSQRRRSAEKFQSAEAHRREGRDAGKAQERGRGRGHGVAFGIWPRS